MIKTSRSAATVGLFVIVGFVMLSTVVFFVSGAYIFRSGYKLEVMYDYVSILDRGAPIRMAGVRIGEVSSVALVEDKTSGKLRVKVKLFIEKGVEIRENYLIMIQGTHILSEPHIEITPQPGNAPVLKGDQPIEGVNPVPLEALIEKAGHIATDLEVVSGNLKNTLGDAESMQALRDVIFNLKKVSASLETALSGSEKDLKNSIQNLEQSSDSIRSIFEKMEKGEGTVGKLFYEDELYQELRAFVAEIKAHPWRLMKKDNGKKFLFF